MMDPATGRRIERAILHATRHVHDRPGLDQLAEVAGLSRFHFDRVFRRWVGLPPVRFVQVLALAEGKRFLDQGRSLLDTSLRLGLSGPSRLHDLFVTLDAVTPGDFRAGGRGLDIAWGHHPTAFGPCLLGLSARGVCYLAIEGDRAIGLGRLRATWPEATLSRDDDATLAVVRTIFEVGPGKPRSADRKDRAPLALHVRGTNFQTQVWRALLDIPVGTVASYGDVARRIGRPGATRAVGTACGANPIGILIPCHRVIRETGELGNYGFGVERKRALLGWEAGLAGPNPRRA